MPYSQKFPICIYLGLFVVMYARCTPGFGSYEEISLFLYQDVCAACARYFAIDIAKLNLKGLCIYPEYTRVSFVWDLLAYAWYIMLVYYVGAYSWYMSLHQNRN